MRYEEIELDEQVRDQDAAFEKAGVVLEDGHRFVNGKCVYCPTTKEVYESHKNQCQESKNG